MRGPAGSAAGRSRTRTGRETRKGKHLQPLVARACDSCHRPSGAAEPSLSRLLRSGAPPPLRSVGPREGRRDSRAARLTGSGRSRNPATRGVGVAWPRGCPARGEAPPGVPARRARRAAPPAALTRHAAVGAHVAAPQPLRHGSRFTCREPRDGRGGGCASALTGPRAALAVPLPSVPHSPGALRMRGEVSPLSPVGHVTGKGTLPYGHLE